MSYSHKGKRYDMPDWDSERDDMPDGSLLFLSDSRGVYIPQHFAESVDFDNTSGIDHDDFAELLAGPGKDWYWEAWSAICDRGTVRSTVTGKVYAIHQDGDCWLIPLDEVQS